MQAVRRKTARYTNGLVGGHVPTITVGAIALMASEASSCGRGPVPCPASACWPGSGLSALPVSSGAPTPTGLQSARCAGRSW